MASDTTKKIGVILMTYGSATTAEHVVEYMRHIYKDAIPPGLVDDFARRYRLVGRSPLVEITQQQAMLLGENLKAATDVEYIVRTGMLHSHPFIEEAVEQCRTADAEKIVGLILSPQFSSFIMEGYRTALRNACLQYDYSEEDIRIAGPWPVEENFVELLSNRVDEGLTKLRIRFGENIPVIFTTHSLPERVVAKDPSYLDQLQKTADAVVAKLNKPDLEWYRGYQSAGHTPEAWLKPDLVDILGVLKDKKKKAVLIVPVQFLADHLEILYDLDIAGKEQCQKYGIAYNRIELPNTDPIFIKTLSAIVQKTI